jgi:hypothetical protein
VASALPFLTISTDQAARLAVLRQRGYEPVTLRPFFLFGSRSLLVLRGRVRCGRFRSLLLLLAQVIAARRCSLLFDAELLDLLCGRASLLVRFDLPLAPPRSQS